MDSVLQNACQAIQIEAEDLAHKAVSSRNKPEILSTPKILPSPAVEEQQNGKRACRDLRHSTHARSSRLWPSDYLRARCPICFSGSSCFSEGYVDFIVMSAPTKLTSLSLSCLVCIDACFMQKHNKHSIRDPRHEHSKTVFVPPEEVEIWKEFVEEVHPRRDTGAKAMTRQFRV